MGNGNSNRKQRRPVQSKTHQKYKNGANYTTTTNVTDYIIDNDRVLTIPRATLNSAVNPMTTSQTFNPIMQQTSGQPTTTTIRTNNSIVLSASHRLMQTNNNGLFASANDDKPNFIALFDYDKATKDDMTIKKNDPLFVIDKKSVVLVVVRPRS
jgi:hypothetical protein